MTHSELRESLVSEWADALKRLLTSMTSEEYTVAASMTPAPEDSQARTEVEIWWAQKSSISPEHGLRVGAGESGWNKLGGAVLNALGVADATSEDILSTAKDLAAQATSAFALRLTESYQTEILFDAIQPSERPSTATYTLVTAGPGNAGAVAVEVAMDDGLIEALLHYPSRQDAESATAAAARPEAGSEEFNPSRQTLKGLKLRVSVILGRTTLPLADILGLGVGSVVDLNKAVTDPVMLVVNGRTVASGRVVVCNGNYAVEVSEAGPTERPARRDVNTKS